MTEQQITLPTVTCLRCGYIWIPRVKNVKWCAKCNSPYWNKEKRKEK